MLNWSWVERGIGSFVMVAAGGSSSGRWRPCVTLAVTALAGLALAAALVISSRSGCLTLPWCREKRRHPLARKEWNNFFSRDGKLRGGGIKFLEKVRSGGVDPSIRAEVWPFLLGVYDMNSSRAERNAIRQQRRKEYEKLRRRCRRSVDEDDKSSSTEETESSDSQSSTGQPTMANPAAEDFATWQHIIRLDAIRADAEWIPYSPSQAAVPEAEALRLASAVGLTDYGDMEPCRISHAARLVAVLEAYALHDPEIGYCQGMSDLLSPILAVMEADDEAFWCFVGFMKRARHNFRLDQAGIKRQLQVVSKLIKLHDADLYQHLEKLEAEDCAFAFRMVLVALRRELTFGQTLCLWEAMWGDQAAVRAGYRGRRTRSAPPTDDLLLYAIAACVLQRRKAIMERFNSVVEIQREFNNIAGQLDIRKVLDDARDMVAALHDKIE
ncbi:RabGAP TBC domain-containing protein [Musa troglodytarum]|uniref:RabGAP TBC domain-containing protein n=1 Tax=Musa troglodytarum TaxID=320322 RepID=A0A9E7EUP7_9LILI|nr:RabGAP TBC domain-containing protein [Musa troglodytarum]